jgi:glycosyltransferase involved in cell wall biosynthesis
VTRPLDILFIGALPPVPGGAPISTGRLLVELARLGHTIRAVAPITERELAGGDGFAERHRDLDIRRFHVPHLEIATGSPPTDEYRRCEGAALAAAAEPLVRARRPDLVLIGRESFAWHVPRLAREWACPSVLLARGNPTRLILDGAYPRAQAEFFLEQFRSAALIITVAEHLAEGLRGLGFPRVIAIPNAVDLDAFVPQPRSTALRAALAVPPEAVVVAHLSNLTRLKRPLDLIVALAALRERLPEVRGVVVGDGPLRTAAEEAAGALGISDAVRFTGWMEHGRIAEFINLADMVVMPSAAEGLARVYLETQACGRLLIASDIPAAREVVTHGVTGLLFRTGDVADLAGQMLRAARAPDLRAAIGRTARAQVARRHGLPEMVRAYDAALARVA